MCLTCGASLVGRDNRGRSYAALTIGGGELSRRVVVEARFPAQCGQVTVPRWVTRAGSVEREQVTFKGNSGDAVG